MSPVIELSHLTDSSGVQERFTHAYYFRKKSINRLEDFACFVFNFQAHSIAEITDTYCDINREKNLYQCLQKHNGK